MHSSGITRQPNATACYRASCCSARHGTERFCSSCAQPFTCKGWPWQAQNYANKLVNVANANDFKSFHWISGVRCRFAVQLPAKGQFLRYRFTDKKLVRIREMYWTDTANTCKYMQIHADTVTDTSAQGKSSLVPNSTRPWRCETGETAQITKLKLHPFLPSAINRRHFRHQTPKCCRLSGFVSKGFTHGRPTRFFRGEWLRVRTLGLCRFQRETALRSDCENKVSYILL